MNSVVRSSIVQTHRGVLEQIEFLAVAMAVASMLKIVLPFSSQSSPVPFLSKPVVFPMRDLSKRTRYSKLFAFTGRDLKVGANIVVDGDPCKVLDLNNLSSGRGASYVRAKIRNQITGTIVEKKFRAASPMEVAVVGKETRQYSYRDGSQYVFMDMKTFEEARLTENEVGDTRKWLKEGIECNFLTWKGKVIDIELPSTVKLTVSETALPSTRSGGGGFKPATLETGSVVQAPLFVDVGDVLVVDTRTGKYISRV